jgi:hypothetical protein
VTPKRLQEKLLDDGFTNTYPLRSPFGIEYAEFLKHFPDNGNSRVDWVGDYQHEGFWGSSRNFSRQVFHDARIDLVSIYFRIEIRMG